MDGRLAVPDMMDRMMHGGAWMALMWLVMLAVAVAVVVLAYKVLTGPGGGSPAGSDDARRILDQRYASGEIDRDEYEERRGTLQAGGS